MKAVESSSSPYAFLLLAAGESRRLGRPKQLLPVGNHTLLEHTIKVCENSNIGPVYVVLGAHARKIQDSISSALLANILIHENWKNGIGSSVAYGVNSIKNQVEKGVILVLVDQVMLDTQHLKNLVEEHRITKAEIIISDYGNTAGPPTFFSNTFFDQLAELTGDQGAKPLVKANKHKVHMVSFPNGNIDIDHEDDLVHLQKIQFT